MLATLRKDLREEEAHRVALQSPALPDRQQFGEKDCDDFDRAWQAIHGRAGANAESGRLGGHRAVVLSDGPHGSGHFWSLTLAVELEGRTVGSCMTTSTSGWRNLSPQGHRLFGHWRTLSDGRLHVWSTLVAGAAEIESLLVPYVYRVSEGALVLDHAATVTEIGRFGQLYARAAELRNDERRSMHQAAADAYRSFAAGTDCPQR